MNYSVWSVDVASDEILLRKEYATKRQAGKALTEHSLKQREDLGGTLKGYMGIDQIVHTAPNGSKTIFYIAT